VPLDSLRGFRLVTSLAVLTEASHLLAFSVDAQRSLLEFVAAGAIELADLGPAQLIRSAELMVKHKELPMDLADATVVVLAEQLRTNMVFTLDRRDFSIYRLGRRSFRLPGPSRGRS
jgi:uncharacterized protein